MVMAAAPDAPIRRLVLNDFGARVAARALRRIGGYLRRRGSFATLDEVEAHLREIHAPFGTADRRAVAPPGRAQRRRRGQRPAALALRPGHRQALLRGRSCSTSCCGSCGSRSTCPVLILRGEDSDLLSRGDGAPRCSDAAPRRASGLVQAVEIAGCGHAPALMDDAQIATSSSDFLLRRPSEPSPPSRGSARRRRDEEEQDRLGRRGRRADPRRRHRRLLRLRRYRHAGGADRGARAALRRDRRAARSHARVRRRAGRRQGRAA